MLSLASELGELGLLLRNEFDASIIEQTVVSSKTLLEAYEESKPVVVYKRVRRPTVEVIRGLEVENLRVQEGKPLPAGAK